MSINTTIARASAALCVAALLGAGGAVAQPLDAQHSLGERSSPGSEADPASCRTAGAPLSLERSLCYRSVANLANERRPLPAIETRPIVIGGTSFDWTDAGVGFGAAAGLGLLAAGSVVALRRRRVDPLRP